MMTIVLVLSLLTHLPASPRAAQLHPEFRIVRSSDSSRLEVSTSIGHLIARTVPAFRPYSGADYLPSIQRQFQGAASVAGPFAVISDFNHDSRLDLAVEGHNGEHRLLLVVLSGGKEYRVRVLETIPLVQPDTTTVVEDGKIVRGFNRYLTLDAYAGSNDGTYAFSVFYIQIETTSGGLSDPGMTRYYFRNDVFVAERIEE